MNERISREDLVKIYNIEITFFDSLADSGLVHPQVYNNVQYLPFEELAAFERFTNLHYDLEINIAGLEVINMLLERLERVTAEHRSLKIASGRSNY